MGIFARLFRRPKATEEAPAAEARADAPEAGTGTAEKAEAAETAETKRPAGAPDAAEPAATGATGTEGVDIPKQQSTAKAAGNEAGEGART
ncbi:hypothetical protein [Streptomyces sp. NPDC052701]|uniref:hypothetical protein n=1 Tax=Streptomyces sp. NPDC052701 TaxID=3155533 RepID=UPI00341671A1